jgi:CheY-like chemotaxis protein/two-component sensor histidine kinase
MTPSEAHLTRFLALLAHELRNPLAPIRNALHVIRLSDPPPRPDHAEQFSVIDRQINHLVRLVDDLLDVARVRQGKIQLQWERLDLAMVVASAIETAQPLIVARSHELVVTMPDEPVIINGDSVRLVQVLSNLLNNAAKYTPEGGRIEVKAKSLQPADREGGHAEIRVRDNGMGIPGDMLPTIFDLFSQDDRTLDRAEGGLGIGLMLVRRLTEMHGGVVEAFSEGPGKGSEFVLRFPLVAEVSAERPTDAVVARVSSGNRRRVLVVDDNHDSLTTMARLLRLLGNEVVAVGTGRDAIGQSEMFAPEIVLLDIGLPDMNGYDVARTLRKQPRFDETLIVALTGYGTMEHRQQSQDAGFNAHLVKPVDLEALQHLLAHPENLRHHALQGELLP